MTDRPTDVFMAHHTATGCTLTMAHTIAECRVLRRGRVLDPGTQHWYKDGYAPFQLPEFIRAECGKCGGELFIFAGGTAICRRCSYGEADDARR